MTVKPTVKTLILSCYFRSDVKGERVKSGNALIPSKEICNSGFGLSQTSLGLVRFI